MRGVWLWVSHVSSIQILIWHSHFQFSRNWESGNVRSEFGGNVRSEFRNLIFRPSILSNWDKRIARSEFALILIFRRSGNVWSVCSGKMLITWIFSAPFLWVCTFLVSSRVLSVQLSVLGFVKCAVLLTTCIYSEWGKVKQHKYFLYFHLLLVPIQKKTLLLSAYNYF